MPFSLTTWGNLSPARRNPLLVSLRTEINSRFKGIYKNSEQDSGTALAKMNAEISAGTFKHSNIPYDYSYHKTTSLHARKAN